MSRELDLFQVKDDTWLLMESVSDRSYRIVKQTKNSHHTYGIFYEGLSAPGVRAIRTNINNFELAKVYLAYELQKERKRHGNSDR